MPHHSLALEVCLKNFSHLALAQVSAMPRTDQAPSQPHSRQPFLSPLEVLPVSLTASAAGKPPTNTSEAFWASTFKSLQPATMARRMLSPQKSGWRRAREFICFGSHGQAPDLQAVSPESLIQPAVNEQVLSLKLQFMILRSGILSTHPVVLSSPSISIAFTTGIPESSTLHLRVTRALCHAAQAHLKQLILLYQHFIPLLLHETGQFFMTSDSASTYTYLYGRRVSSEKNKRWYRKREHCA